MSSIFSHNISLSLFGQSHSDAVGVTIDSFPSGMKVDTEALNEFMKRRAPGSGDGVSARDEDDEVIFLCGLKDGYTCGSPITAIIKNRDGKRQEHAPYESTPRPSHADYTQLVKFGSHADISGGGHLSGRLTAPLCIAGALAIQYLKEKGITVSSNLISVGGEEIEISEKIRAAKEEGDSLGGVVLALASGVPAGLGSPLFYGLENVISSFIFAIPGVKAIEFGDGIEGASMKGSEYNDEFCLEGDTVKTRTNHCGGILGGISNGDDIVFSAFFKPTPSIALKQNTVDLSKKEECEIKLETRNDTCIALRGRAAVEAACALSILDAYLG